MVWFLQKSYKQTDGYFITVLSGLDAIIIYSKKHRIILLITLFFSKNRKFKLQLVKYHECSNTGYSVFCFENTVKFFMILPPGTPLLVQGNESFNAPVVCFFRINRKITCWKFTHSTVIIKAIATYTCPAARVGTVAKVFVTVFITFH